MSIRATQSFLIPLVVSVVARYGCEPEKEVR